MPETKSLFNRVAQRYDVLNTLFSFGMDKSWRKRLAQEVGDSAFVLDIATGTAEVAIEIVNRCNGCYVIGIDPSEEMLGLGQKKLESLGVGDKITLLKGFAENLPFKDCTFDAATIAFGIRNTVDPLKSLEEMKRVLKPGGKACILEFAVPENRLFAPPYMFYLGNVLPFIGSFFGKKKEYEYLADSTAKFPQRGNFTTLMEHAGFTVEKSVELTMGTVVLYVGIAVKAQRNPDDF